jgi:hypothetical protein
MQYIWDDSIVWDDSAIWDESAPALTPIDGGLSVSLANISIESSSQFYKFANLEITLDNFSLVSESKTADYGSVSIEIGLVTSEITGGLRVSGSASMAIGAIVITSQDAANPIRAVFAKPLGAIVLSSAAFNPISGTLSKSIDSIGCLASGQSRSTAEVNSTIDEITLVSESKTIAVAQASISLGDIAIECDSDISDVYKIDVTLGDVSLSSSGSLLIDGALSQTLGNVTLKPVNFAFSSPTVNEITLSATIRPSISGQLGVFLDPVTSVITATIMPITLTNEDIDRISNTVASRLYALLAGIRPSVSLTYNPLTFALTLVQGDDYLTTDQRTIDIPVTLPAGIVAADCTATFGAKKGTDRIDAEIAAYVGTDSKVYARLTLPDTATQPKPPGKYSYDIEFQYNGSNITVVSGVLTLLEGIARDISEFD